MSVRRAIESNLNRVLSERKSSHCGYLIRIFCQSRVMLQTPFPFGFMRRRLYVYRPHFNSVQLNALRLLHYTATTVSLFLSRTLCFSFCNPRRTNVGKSLVFAHTASRCITILRSKKARTTRGYTPNHQDLPIETDNAEINIRCRTKQPKPQTRAPPPLQDILRNVAEEWHRDPTPPPRPPPVGSLPTTYIPFEHQQIEKAPVLDTGRRQYSWFDGASAVFFYYAVFNFVFYAEPSGGWYVRVHPSNGDFRDVSGSISYLTRQEQQLHGSCREAHRTRCAPNQSSSWSFARVLRTR